MRDPITPMGVERPAAAWDDARRLVADLHSPDTAGDGAALGVVLREGERLLRCVPAWARQWTGSAWSAASPSEVIVTDARLIVRLGSGELAVLWWGAVVGFEANLLTEHLVLDFGDGQPRLVSGPEVAVIAVAAVAALYGLPALATHPCLAPLRVRAPVASTS